jgi:hypothetical protein
MKWNVKSKFLSKGEGWCSNPQEGTKKLVPHDKVNARNKQQWQNVEVTKIG